MKCPIDGSDLVMTERQGVEIDYCPQCRGVWLDRGELDKILERSATALAPPPQAAPERYPARPGGGYHGDPYHHRKKRKSFLDDLFDF